MASTTGVSSNGRDVEGRLPGCEHRHAQDGWVRVEAPLLRPWASPGDLAEEFRRRAGLSSRDLTSCTRSTWTTLTDSLLWLFSRILHARTSGGESREESCSDDGKNGYVA